MLSRNQSHHVTDDAGHRQTRLPMLAISHLLCVWGAAVRHLLSILGNRWVALTARVSREYDIIHECTSHTCIARWHRPHLQQQLQKHTYANTVPAIGQTMQVGDNYLNDGHLPPERPWIDGQSATECRHAVHHMEITWASIMAFVKHFELGVCMPGGLFLGVWYAGDIDFWCFRTELKQFSKYARVYIEWISTRDG